MPSAGDLAWRLRLPTPIHEAGKSALTGFGTMTASLRTLPDYLIIGVQRGGTTSLSRYLGSHPNVQSSTHKEIHYFDLNYGWGEAWYRGHFPTRGYRRLIAARKGLSLTGEASPYYMFHPLAAGRAAEVLPSVRLIVMLRDPVERAISHYYHCRRRGVELLSLEEALDREAERLEGEEKRIEDEPGYDSPNHRFFSYVARGMYARQLRRWFDVFPREQVLVIESGRFRSEPEKGFANVLEFLDLPPFHLQEFKQHNAKEHEEADPATVERLASIFRPHNSELFDLLGTDFGWNEDRR